MNGDSSRCIANWLGAAVPISVEGFKLVLGVSLGLFDGCIDGPPGPVFGGWEAGIEGLSDGSREEDGLDDTVGPSLGWAERVGWLDGDIVVGAGLLEGRGDAVGCTVGLVEIEGSWLDDGWKLDDGKLEGKILKDGIGVTVGTELGTNEIDGIAEGS